MTRSDQWKKRPVTQRYWAFKDALKLISKSKKFTLSESGDLVVFLVPMPSSWSKKKRESSHLSPHRNRPDLDNYLKALWDALEAEDKHIYATSAVKLWSYEGAIIVFRNTQ